MAELLVPHMPPGKAIAEYLVDRGIWLDGQHRKMDALGYHRLLPAGRTWVEEHPELRSPAATILEGGPHLWTLWASYAWADKGIRVNLISPGPTQTPMMPDFERT